MATTKKLGDLMVTNGTYSTGGALKGKSLNIGSVFISDGRIWATIDAHILPFNLVNDNRRACKQLGLVKGDAVNSEIQLSLLQEKGKPLTYAALTEICGNEAGSAGGTPENSDASNSNDDIDFS